MAKSDQDAATDQLPLPVFEDRAATVRRQQRQQFACEGAGACSPATSTAEAAGEHAKEHRADVRPVRPLTALLQQQGQQGNLGGSASTSMPNGQNGSYTQPACFAAHTSMHVQQAAATTCLQQAGGPTRTCSTKSSKRKQPYSQKQRPGKQRQTGRNWWEQGAPQRQQSTHCVPRGAAQQAQGHAMHALRQEDAVLPPHLRLPPAECSLPPHLRQQQERKPGVPMPPSGPRLLPRSVALVMSGASPPQLQQQAAQQGAPPTHAGPVGAQLSQLHYEVEAFARQAAPQPAEAEAVQRAAHTVGDAALEVWPDCQVLPFGSQATSMGLPGSDVDIAILGVGQPAGGAGGFRKAQRSGVAAELQKLLRVLRQRGVLQGKAEVISAKVPIIKCHIGIGQGVSIPTDISLGAANGAEAVPFILQQMDVFGPPLRCLVLVLKALLKEARLNERATGGLGSYCLLNLVMAHLLAERISAASPADLGALLLAFLKRFGADFDYMRQAVSVRQGGIVGKSQAWRQKKRAQLLALEDPQQPGIDIGSGSFNITEIKRYLGEAHARLQSACGQPHARHAAAQQAAAWAAVQVDGQDASVQQPTSAAFPLLSGLLNVSLALDRNPQAAQARSELAVAFGNVSAKRRNKLAVSINRLRAAAVHSPRAARRAAQLLAPAPAGRPKKKKKKKKKKKTDSKGAAPAAGDVAQQGKVGAKRKRPGNTGRKAPAAVHAAQHGAQLQGQAGGNVKKGVAAGKVTTHQHAHGGCTKRKQQKKAKKQQAAGGRVASGANGVPVKLRRGRKMQHVV